MGTTMFIWQLFCLAVIGGVGFLVIRVLIVKNFPRKEKPGAATPSLDFYPVVISWSSAGRKFAAEVPDLPGCVANGTTKAAALAASAVAIGQWLDAARELGREVPTPREHLRIAA